MVLKELFNRIFADASLTNKLVKRFSRCYAKVALTVLQLDAHENLEVLSQLTWSHNLVLMEKLDKVDDRLWYAQKAIENGWSRDVMATWIKSDLHSRQGKAITNFKSTLPAPQLDLAIQLLKDPYLFDFLELREDRAVSHSLVSNTP